MEEFALGSHSALAAASGCPSFMSVLLLEGARHAASHWGCVPPCCSFLGLVDEPTDIECEGWEGEHCLSELIL